VIEAETIGPGLLMYGPIRGSSLPPPLSPGDAIGQHLRVERLVRAAPGRMLYLVNNLGPKWNKRLCWACGNKYSDTRARTCTFCRTPLVDLRFLATARWSKPTMAPWERWLQLRAKDPSFVRPVAMLYRGSLMITIYHYNGEALLLDEPSPLGRARVVSLARQLAGALAFLHDTGAITGPIGPEHVLLMPDGSARLYDPDVLEVLPSREAVYRHTSQPPRRDVRALARLLMRYCSPEDEDLLRFLRGAAHGAHASPAAFRTTLDSLFGAETDVEPSGAASAMSDLGLVRGNNEDAWRWRRLPDGAALYVVADGMGGQEGGEIASQTAVDRLCQVMGEGAADPTPAGMATRIAAATREANHEVLSRASTAGVRMGTTLVTAALVPEPAGATGDGAAMHAVVGNVGDSRCYLYREGVLTLLTADHTVVAELIADGDLTPEEAAAHPSAHMLTRSLGGELELGADVTVHRLQPEDRLLLCSDGLWGAVPHAELEWLIGTIQDRRELLQSLVRAAYAGGGHDNVTALVIDAPTRSIT
jgi:protein phosphatase